MPECKADKPRRMDVRHMMDWRERITLTGQIVISVVIVVGFFSIRALMIFVEILPANQRSADTFDGALIGAFSAVVGFWVGSSSSAQKKDATIREMANKDPGKPTGI